MSLDLPNAEKAEALGPFTQDPNISAAINAQQDGQRLAAQNTEASHLKAIEKYEEAARLFRASHENRSEATALLAISRSYIFLKEPQKGVAYIKQALPLLEAVGDRKLLVGVLLNLGFTHTRLGEHHEALNNFKKALPLVQGEDSRVLLSLTLSGIGAAYVSLGDRRQAVTYFNRALPIFKALADYRGEASTFGILGTLYTKLGDPQNALASLDQALSLARQSNNQKEQATFLNGLGEVYRLLGDKPKALGYYNQALIQAKASNYVLGQSTILNDMGLVHDDLGHKQQALDYFNQALQLSRKVEGLLGGAPNLSNIGAVYSSMNEYQKALDFYLQAEAVTKANKDNAGEASVLTNIGSIYLALHQYPKALEYFERSLPLFQFLADRTNEGTTCVLIGNVYESSGDSGKALNYYNRALALGRAVQDPRLQVSALDHIASLNNILGHRRKALAGDTQALNLLRDKETRAEKAQVLHSLGVIYQGSKNYRKALEHYKQALLIEQEMIDRQGEAATLGNIDSIYEQRTKLRTALDHYQKAIAVQEKIRTEARLEEFKIKLAEQSFNLYVRAMLIELRLAHPVQAFNLSERARARVLLDQMGNARVDLRKGTDGKLIQDEQTLRFELASLDRHLAEERAKPKTEFNPEIIAGLQRQLSAKRIEYEDFLTDLKVKAPEYASIFSVDTLTLPETQKFLDQETTLISYFVTTNSTLAFVVTRDSFKAVTLPAKAADITAQIINFRGFADLDNPYPKPCNELYRMLLSPLEPFLKTRRVGIIPNGILHYLPFSALLHGKRFFGEDHEVYYLPSASVLRFIQRRRQLAENVLLALGHGQSEGLPILQYATESTSDVASLFGETPLLDNAATETAFRQKAVNSNAVFIAAHGKLNTVSPLFSKIVLAADASNDGLLEVHEIYGLDLKNVSLIVLSGCETELGSRSEGDDVIGLNRALMYAGTSTVVASLWSVKEQPTGKLMVSFFKYLEQGMSSSEALEKAQREIRDRYPHPYYWAAFVLTGDPGTSIPLGR